MGINEAADGMAAVLAMNGLVRLLIVVWALRGTKPSERV
jgi:hypothetical protein